MIQVMGSNKAVHLTPGSTGHSEEIEMSKAEDFRIEDVQKPTVNGVAVKLFKAFKKDGDAFVHVGQFSAPHRTANKDLWKIAADAA